MKKVYVLVAAVIATFGALSVGSATFAAPGDSVPSDSVPATDDTVPATEVPTTVIDSTTSTTVESTVIDSTTTTMASQTTDSTAAPTTAALGVTESSDQVGQEAPTSTIRRVGSDGLLPNTGGDVAIPLILALLAAGTGAATLLVRRRSNAS